MTDSAASSTNTTTLLDQHGRGFGTYTSKGSIHWETMKAAQIFGDLFKWHYSDLDFQSYRPLTLRVNLAVTSEELATHIERLLQCATGAAQKLIVARQVHVARTSRF